MSRRHSAGSDPASPDLSSPAKRKRFVENECRRRAELVRSVREDYEPYLSGIYGARRQRAVLNAMDRVEKEFGGPGLEAAEGFVNSELTPYHNYNQLDEDCDVSTAAALWILDKLRKHGKLRDAYGILPDTSDDMDIFYLQLDFHHPCYDRDLIQSVIHILRKRYGQESVMNEENARGKSPGDRFLSLLALLPEADIQKACDTFREKQWELVARKVKGKACLQERLNQIEREVEVSLDGTRFPLARPGIPSLTYAEKGKPDVQAVVDAVGQKWENTLRQISELDLDFGRYLHMSWRQLLRELGSRDIADGPPGSTLEDPFEICFALFHLLDHGDDAPWLVDSGTTLVNFARQMLPWYEDRDGWESEQWDAWYEGMSYNRNGWLEREAPPEDVDYYHETHNGRNLAQVIYGLCRGVVPVGLHPFEADREQLVREGMPEERAKKIADVAGMLFLQAFQAKQVNYPGWIPPEDQEAEKAAAVPEHSEVPTKPRPGSWCGKMLADQGMPEEEAALPEENREMAAELEAARKQLRNLRAVLMEERHAADAERARYERELKSLRMEHRELADLRSLVFNRDSEEREKLEKPEKAYAYPYVTKKRTVVFGGHDSFLKVIRPMLPEVRFVDAGSLAFSPDIIRNAEVVWIQNNCISHSQFWNIVRVCRQAGVQMRYFAYASAEKCAEQLVSEDMK